MFERWVQKTSSEIATLIRKSGERGPAQKAIARGSATAADNDETLEMRVTLSTIANTIAEITVGSHASARKTPPAVATPFPPPFPMRKIGRTCPITAAVPNAIAHQSRGTDVSMYSGRISAGSIPFSVSQM
jgi:hypothetical protein